MLSVKWRRCVGLLFGETLLSLCYLFEWVSLYLLDTSSCSLSTLCCQGGGGAEFGLALVFVSVTVEVQVRWRLCWRRGDCHSFLSDSKASHALCWFSSLKCLFLWSTFLTTLLNPHSLHYMWNLSLKYIHSKCSGQWLFVYAEFWTDQPNSFLKNIPVVAPIEISIKPPNIC